MEMKWCVFVTMVFATRGICYREQNKVIRSMGRFVLSYSLNS